MNKQEIMNFLNEEIKNHQAKDTPFQRGYRIAAKRAREAFEQLDGPEKPVLTEEEAEWVDKLTDFYSLPDALYYITRWGYGYYGYSFNFEMCGKTYELPVDSGATYGEIRKLKERLVDAVIYGYEVEKEKLYEVFLKRTGAQLGVCVPHGEDKTQFTKVELQEYGFDNLDEYEVEEVEE